MPQYTNIALLPYPAPTDPPNGPDQILQLARALEPKLVNRYANASDRSSKITAPTAGMLSFRDDAKVLEYWNAATQLWTGTDQTVCASARGAVSSATDRAFTTTESPALVKSTVSLKNPSSLYRMAWYFGADFNAGYTWSAAGQYATVRHYAQFGTAAGVNRAYSNYTLAGGSANMSGQYPPRTGSIGPNETLTVSTWITIEKSGGAAGTITLILSSTDFSLFGVTTT